MNHIFKAAVKDLDVYKQMKNPEPFLSQHEFFMINTSRGAKRRLLMLSCESEAFALHATVSQATTLQIDYAGQMPGLTYSSICVSRYEYIARL